MSAELRALLALVLLRAGPQDLPYAPSMGWRWVVIALGIDFMVYTQLLDLDQGVARLLLSAAVNLLLVGGLLHASQRLPRLQQTLAAWFGCGTLLTLAFAPLAWYASGLPTVENAESIGAEHIAVDLAWLGVVSWNLMVDAHILRHALDRPLRVTVPLAIAQFILNTGLDQWLFASTPAS